MTIVLLFLAATAVALALWALLVAALSYATRSPAVRPGPATGELRPESPAVVDLITGNWRLCDEAASATLLDLAAKGAVEIEEIGPELSLVRVREPRGPLAPYEKLVYDHVRSLAVDGVVATGALAEGARSLGRWWKSFRRKVIDEARAQGLSRARWSKAQATLLTFTAAVPAGLAGLTVAFHADDDSRGGGIGAAVIAFALLSGLVGRLNGERGTAAGAAAAGYWLGVREHLAAGDAYAERPAAAVTIWGRHMAYAAALGLAGRAVAGLPVSVPADDRRAWSDYGGMWHVVDVRYPRRILRGRSPAAIALSGAVSGLFAGFWTWIVGIAVNAFGLWPEALVLPGGLLVGGTVAALPIAWAVADLAARAELEGQVVRLRRVRVSSDSDSSVKYIYWVALDDGRAREVVAYGADEATWQPLAEGDVVRARVSRRVGWVHEAEILRRSRHRDTATYDDTGEHTIDAPRDLGEAGPLGPGRGERPARAAVVPDRVAALLTPADLRRVLGVETGPAGVNPDGPVTPGWLATESCRFRGTGVRGGAEVTVDVYAASGRRGGYLMVLGHLLTRVQGRPVDGLGSGAMLYPGVIAARTGSGTFAVHVHSPAGPPPPGALVALARTAAERMEGRSPVA
ncbi:hypothetical protein ABGB17_23200 [Sphaerisporangium sp. B11E5]|uniref:DUF2207 family protein n=1 Tax=Sphaerisporangium sp. B11E5 TaxID=3153563 RepID=UPI00325E5034